MGELELRKIYVYVELLRLAWVNKTEEKNNIYAFYPHLKDAYINLIITYFDLDPKDCPITPNLLFLLRDGAPSGAYCDDLIQDEDFAHLEEAISFEEKVEIAKALLEIDMTYKQKQQEYNSKGLYIHYHKLLGFHRKFTDSLMG